MYKFCQVLVTVYGFTDSFSLCMYVCVGGGGNFLLPAGGALIIMEYSYLDVFRPGFLSNMWSLGQIEHCMAELQQLLFPWQDIEICDAAKGTPFNKNSRSSQFNITKAFRLDWPNNVLHLHLHLCI